MTPIWQNIRRFFRKNVAREMATGMAVALSQDVETPVTRFQTGGFCGRYAYGRAAETRFHGDRGQDYLAFCVRGESLAFALCDGVGLSFYGELAARLLGEELLRWLITDLPDSLQVERIAPKLAGALLAFTADASEVVKRQRLPLDAFPMLRETLERKRELGSETAFLCGRVDQPGKRFSGGRLCAAWLGDCRLRLWGRDGELFWSDKKLFQTKERWSSQKGPVGEAAHLLLAPLRGSETLTGLTVYSDGLALLDDYAKMPGDGELETLIARAGELAASDDFSLFDVCITGKGGVA